MKKKILVIDDSQTQLKSITLKLKKNGYEVLSTTDSIEGIKLAYSSLPDLIVSDIVMPEIDGYQLCRLLKNDNLTKNIPIILLTELNDKLDKFWGLKTGADIFLTKDDNLKNLMAHIEKFLSKDNDSTHERKLNQNDPDFLNVQSRITNLLDQLLIESTIINEFKQLSKFVINTEILIDDIFSLVSSILDYDLIGIFFNDTDSKRGKTIYLNVLDKNVDSLVLNEVKEDFFTSILSKDINIKEYSYELINSINYVPGSCSQIEDFKTRIITPIYYEDQLLGGFCFYDKNPDKFSETTPEGYRLNKIFNIILEEIKLLMRKKWHYSETRYLSMIDALTELYNRRYFDEALSREFERSKKYNRELSLVMFDIDYFKKLNDQYGHQFGDLVLAKVSAIIKHSLRKTDYAARCGGEEFVAILPETNLYNTYIPMERIRKAIEAQEFMYEDKIVNVTISIGITNLTINVKSEQEFLLRADKALYRAKENGRNRIELDYDK